MIRLDRNRQATDVWLGEKMIFFAIGAALGISGMITGTDWLIWAAIAVLILGFVLRVLGRRGQGAAEDMPPPEERDSDWARAYEAEEPAAGPDDDPVGEVGDPDDDGEARPPA
jgi:hypothetical protein